MNSPHKGQQHGALIFSLICAWINYWVNNREDGDLRRHRAYYDVTAMSLESPMTVNLAFPSTLDHPTAAATTVHISQCINYSNHHSTKVRYQCNAGTNRPPPWPWLLPEMPISGEFKCLQKMEDHGSHLDSMHVVVVFLYWRLGSKQISRSITYT